MAHGDDHGHHVERISLAHRTGGLGFGDGAQLVVVEAIVSDLG
jgi:hypothetical protein